MGRLEVNPDNLDRVAKKLRTVAANLTGRAKQINGYTKDVELCWQSASTPIYNEKVTDMAATVERLAESIATEATQLEAIARSVRQTEAELASKMSGGRSGGGSSSFPNHHRGGYSGGR